MGGFGDYAIYEKQTNDANWLFFFYDTAKSGWDFGYSSDRIIPGITLLGKTVSEVFPSGRSVSGKTSNNLIFKTTSLIFDYA